MGYFPFPAFIRINEGVSRLDFVTGCTHCKFVNSVVHAPVVSNGYVRLQNFALGFLLTEIDKVGFDGIIIGAWDIYRKRWATNKVRFPWSSEKRLDQDPVSPRRRSICKIIHGLLRW